MDQQKQSRAPADTGDAAPLSIDLAGKRVDAEYTRSARHALDHSLDLERGKR
jgi:hypothetical protein